MQLFAFSIFFKLFSFHLNLIYMKHIIFLLLSCCNMLSISTAKAQDLEMYERRVFVTKGDSLPYRILYPENFDSGKKYPLVMVLHGAGERGGNNESQLVHGAKLFLEPENRSAYPAIVVFPQCPKDSYWSNVNIVTAEDGKRTFNFKKRTEDPTKAMHALLGLLKELERSGTVDKKQLYLGGLSMGGMGTFELLRRKPRKFAAAFPICGGGHPDGAKRYAKRLNLWVFHGEEDSVVPVEKSQEMVAALQKAGGNVKLTIYPGVNHNSWDNAFAEPTLLAWLFSHRK